MKENLFKALKELIDQLQQAKSKLLVQAQNLQLELTFATNLMHLQDLWKKINSLIFQVQEKLHISTAPAKAPPAVSRVVKLNEVSRKAIKTS
jgi:hypothetical protein